MPSAEREGAHALAHAADGAAHIPKVGGEMMHESASTRRMMMSRMSSEPLPAHTWRGGVRQR
jgi:hypothetical protein